MGIDVEDVDRGGDVTYHGPGQLVAYPILNLRKWKCSVSWYLRTLEEVLITTLAEFDLNGERNPGFTGVWVNGAKVAAVGVGIRDWVTYHGISLNVDPNMDHWSLIVPCGIPDKPVTSLRMLCGGAPPSVHEVADVFEDRFRRVFETG
jgi:lipoyl(octanoyl) transferase